jgi:hypothetical protein
LAAGAGEALSVADDVADRVLVLSGWVDGAQPRLAPSERLRTAQLSARRRWKAAASLENC